MTLENNLVKIQNNQVVVSSRQVAENFGKRHAHVIDAVEKHINDLQRTDFSVGWFYETEYTDSKGETRKEYLMNYEGFSLLVMSFSNTRDVLAWKLKYIQAFNEMKAQLKSQAVSLPNFNNPADAARAWATEFEAKQIAEAKVTELAPKATVYDAFVDREHLVGFRQLAKELGVKESVFRNFLQTAHIAYRAKNGWMPYAPMVDKGYLTIKDTMNSENGWTGTQMAFTMTGKEYIRQLLLDNGVI